MPTNNGVNTSLSGRSGTGSFLGDTAPIMTLPDMSNTIVANVASPVSNLDGVNKQYVDTEISAAIGGLGSTYVTLATTQTITGAKTFQSNIDMDNNSVLGLPLPTLGNEAASKDYVDGIAFNVHPAAIYGTVANFASTYDNGAAGVGATLTATSNGAFTTDGQSPALNDRILVLQQTNQAQNGIYVLSTVGDGSNPAVLTRANDYNQASDMQAGDNVSIVSGDTLAGSKWMMNQTAVITVGTTDITWLNIPFPLNVVTLDGTQTITGAKTMDSLTLGGNLDADSNKIVNLLDPTLDQDAATKKYVDDNASTGSGDALQLSILLMGG